MKSVREVVFTVIPQRKYFQPRWRFGTNPNLYGGTTYRASWLVFYFKVCTGV